jgi:hypothetical protein
LELKIRFKWFFSVEIACYSHSVPLPSEIRFPSFCKQNFFIIFFFRFVVDPIHQKKLFWYFSIEQTFLINLPRYKSLTQRNIKQFIVALKKSAKTNNKILLNWSWMASDSLVFLAFVCKQKWEIYFTVCHFQLPWLSQSIQKGFRSHCFDTFRSSKKRKKEKK